MCINADDIRHVCTWNQDLSFNQNNDEFLKYESTYPALLEAGKRCRENPDIINIKILALAVYGWMPCILGRHGNMGYETSEDNSDNNINSIDESIGKSVKKFCQSGEELNDFEKLKFFIDKSWVGLSKFLHFLRPDRYAIWDSNVSRALLFAHQATQQNPNIDINGVGEIINRGFRSRPDHANNNYNNFLNYERTVQGLLRLNEYNEVAQEQGDYPSRYIEKRLFCFGQRLKR